MKTKELQLVSFYQAKRLKKVGFDWKTDKKWGRWSAAYSSKYGWCIMSLGEMPILASEQMLAPSVALALKWCRDEKGITGFVDRNACGWYWEINKADNGTFIKGMYDEDEFESPESAESALLDELLDLIK